MPSAFLWAQIAEMLFLLEQYRTDCGLSGIAFFTEGAAKKNSI
jgi:hypothetical protein